MSDYPAIKLGESGEGLLRQARVVIVGGGVVGCSIAYHLAKLGWKDVVLLEQNALAGGTTWHAAGLVGQLRASNSMTKINRYSVELYQTLEAETGHPTGWNEVGSLIAATSEARMTQLRRTASMAGLFGVDARLIGADEARERWPLMRTDDLLGAVWLPRDGKVKPKEVAIALAKGARMKGAALYEGARVTDVKMKKGRAAGVATSHGEIQADIVILCGGMWTRELGLRCGVSIPLYPVEHHYVVTEPIEGAHDNLPVGRDPEEMIYFRSEEGGIMLGAFQKFSKPWMVDRIPGDFSFGLLEPDWEKFEQPLRAGKWRMPCLENAKFAKFVNGPESFTPDNNFIMGEAPGVPGLFVAAGFNSVGIASAGGAGKWLAEWLEAGEPTMDLWSVDIRRFLPCHNNRAFLRARVAEVLGLHYQPAWPNREFETGRGLRRGPLHERLAARGACFGQKNGLERPNWFAPPGVKPETEYSFGKQSWHGCSAAEHMAARERVAIFDQTSFSKFILKGRDACAVLQRLCGADVDVAVGGVVYTGMFNGRGTFESDLTLVRLCEGEYYIVTASGQTVRDFDWIATHIPDGARAELVDVTPGWGVLGVMGPNSRALLAAVSDADLSNAAFPYMTARWIDAGPARALAARVTYVGELGWELHAPADQLAAIYDAIMEAGAPLGAVNAGHYAINSLRLEKGYRAWGAEISPDDNPIEAGLGFAVAWDKTSDFIGRDALLKLKGATPTRRLATFVLEDPGPMLWGNEPILRNGRPVGYTTSGAYGHALGAAVAMGYVKHPEGATAEFVLSGKYDIEIDGQRYSAKAFLRASYDPKREKILG